MNGRLSAAALVVLLTAASAWAHHSFTAVFDLSKKVTVTGTLTKIDWRNPHIEVFLDAKREGDQVEAWRIEGMPPNFFRSRNVTKVDFENAMGKALTVTASRARDGSTYGLMEKITFPDGKSVTVIEQAPAQPASAGTQGAAQINSGQ